LARAANNLISDWNQLNVTCVSKHSNKADMEGDYHVKKVGILTVVLALLIVAAYPALAAVERSYRSEFGVMGGNDGRAWAGFWLGKSLQFNVLYEDEIYRGGFLWQPSANFGLKLGSRYDPDTEVSDGYGGIDFKIPFGNNLQFAGWADYNYEGPEWTRYEFSVRIEMFKNQFVHAGVRGDSGDGFVPYEFNPENDPAIFLKGDINFVSKSEKFVLQIRPLLYIKGTFFHDYDFAYNFGKKTALLFNFNSLYDTELNYSAGLRWRF
jgi:hypothetical protein